jgi:hypothetical protein
VAQKLGYSWSRAGCETRCLGGRAACCSLAAARQPVDACVNFSFHKGQPAASIPLELKSALVSSDHSQSNQSLLVSCELCFFLSAREQPAEARRTGRASDEQAELRMLLKSLFLASGKRSLMLTGSDSLLVENHMSHWKTASGRERGSDLALPRLATHTFYQAATAGLPPDYSNATPVPLPIALGLKTRETRGLASYPCSIGAAPEPPGPTRASPAAVPGRHCSGRPRHPPLTRCRPLSRTSWRRPRP